MVIKRTVRARAESMDGTRVTFRLPCGCKQTRDFAKGPPHRRLSPLAVRMFFRYWQDSVAVPACRKRGH